MYRVFESLIKVPILYLSIIVKISYIKVITITGYKYHEPLFLNHAESQNEGLSSTIQLSEELTHITHLVSKV